MECIICAFEFDSSVHLQSFGICGHNDICSLCFLRIRSIQRNFTCPSCKQELDKLICSDKQGVSFNDFNIWGDNIGNDFILDQKSQVLSPF